jgi:hypothetical protein
MKFACACCGYKTLDHPPNGSYDICVVCFWEDDLLQLSDPNYEGGANTISLKTAQENFARFGASQERFLINVRPPLRGEARDGNWKPLD